MSAPVHDFEGDLNDDTKCYTPPSSRPVSPIPIFKPTLRRDPAYDPLFLQSSPLNSDTEYDSDGFSAPFAKIQKTVIPFPETPKSRPDDEYKCLPFDNNPYPGLFQKFIESQIPGTQLRSMPFDSGFTIETPRHVGGKRSFESNGVIIPDMQTRQTVYEINSYFEKAAQNLTRESE